MLPDDPVVVPERVMSNSIQLAVVPEGNPATPPANGCPFKVRVMNVVVADIPVNVMT